jgi:hypothetical protein
LAELRGNWAAETAQLEITERQISACTVKAPFDGVVTARLAAVGQFASRGMALLRLLETRQPEVSAQVQSHDSAALRLADGLQFEHDGRHYRLRLRTVLSAIRTETGTQEARLEFIDSPAEPGAAGCLLWHNKQPHLAPERLIKRGEQWGVFVEQAGRAHFHALPAQQGRPVIAALPPDSRVIVSGQFGLEDGAAVQAVESP